MCNYVKLPQGRCYADDTNLLPVGEKSELHVVSRPVRVFAISAYYLCHVCPHVSIRLPLFVKFDIGDFY